MTVHRQALFAAHRGDWETPPTLFAQLDQEFRFALDVCATERTRKCERYYSPAEDGLRQPWDGICWCNPPYGRQIGWWVEKAYQSVWSGSASVVVCLLPSRTDTQWWHRWVMRAREVRFIAGRIRFVGATENAPFPVAVVVF